ncbi:MAG: DUF481 domain-containing protein [Gammaproteobacteria bacterium]|nr:DUF481 domain-containing protein [Gammaproteobacteria bacterium]MDE0225319.1 DUF481 domain-containing protein [Gammaproteobacteria bacterium]MDE0450182.1 DUF481 domain-containing protein [Gammaproteobacteria bacterium]
MARDLAILLLWTIAFADVARADVVHFVNGDRLTGRLVEAETGYIALDVANIGVVTVPVEVVEQIDEEIPAKDDAATSADAETAATRGAAWEATADAGATVSRGNTDAVDVALVFAAKRSGQRFDHIFDVNTAKSSARGDVTRDHLDIEYDLRRKYGDRWYAVGSFEIFRDAIKDIDQRYTAGIGGGYAIFAGERGALTTDIGISQVLEESISARESSPALRWGVDFNRWIVPEQLEVFHTHQLLGVLDSDRGLFWDSGTGVRLYLSEHWNMSVRLDVQHETQPTPGRRKTDATSMIAIGAKF